jgi:hypothetical protein
MLSFIITKNHNTTNTNNEKCINPKTQDFIFGWIKLTIDVINCSNIIINNNDNVLLLKSLQNVITNKNQLIILFNDIYLEPNIQNIFRQLIDEEIDIKIILCYKIKENNKQQIYYYSQLLLKNSHDLGNFFNDINKNPKIKLSIDEHTKLYIKSLHFIKKTSNVEITRDLLLSSLTTVRNLVL